MSFNSRSIGEEGSTQQRSSRRHEIPNYGPYDYASDVDVVHQNLMGINTMDMSMNQLHHMSNRKNMTMSMSGKSNKKRKLTDDEKLNRCRERNRIHARNTRERKKLQMDTLQMRVHQLNDEVSSLLYNVFF